MLVIKKFTFNPFMENTYVVWDEKSGEGAVVDPGCFDPFEEKKLEDFISERKIKLKYLINTHCHIDHILGNKFIKDTYQVPFYAPEPDLPLIEHADKQAAAFGIEIKRSPLPDLFITEELILKFGEIPVKFLFTPGHTPGEYCLYFEKEELCITGDVLFKGSIGRTDLWGGNYDTLIDSINKKLLTLPDEVIIYPGHGDNSTIGDEKKENPFLKETSN